jgi:PP-loop superfamily ATP-utilizing enzyme
VKSFFPKSVIVRARDHGQTVRLEIENNLWTNLSKSSIMKITEGLKRLGYSYITMDMEGYIPAGRR